MTTPDGKLVDPTWYAAMLSAVPANNSRVSSFLPTAYPYASLGSLLGLPTLFPPVYTPFSVPLSAPAITVTPPAACTSAVHVLLPVSSPRAPVNVDLAACLPPPPFFKGEETQLGKSARGWLYQTQIWLEHTGAISAPMPSIIRRLDGSALNWWRNLERSIGRNITFPVFEAHFAGIVKSTASMQARKILRNIEQCSNESATDLITRFEDKLADITVGALPNNTSQAELLIDALHDDFIQRHLVGHVTEDVMLDIDLLTAEVRRIDSNLQSANICIGKAKQSSSGASQRATNGNTANDHYGKKANDSVSTQKRKSSSGPTSGAKRQPASQPIIPYNVPNMPPGVSAFGYGKGASGADSWPDGVPANPANIGQPADGWY